MAVNFITITENRLGLKLRRLVDLTREVTNLFEQVKATMDSQVDAGDYSLMETQFGLAAGDGETAYNLTAGAKAAVEDSAITQMISWMG